MLNLIIQEFTEKDFLRDAETDDSKKIVTEEKNKLYFTASLEIEKVKLLHFDIGTFLFLPIHSNDFIIEILEQENNTNNNILVNLLRNAEISGKLKVTFRKAD